MLTKTLKQDDAIFKALDLKTINRLICTTDKGVLTLQIRKGETNYHLCLDSVPLDKELNKTLMELLFPIPKLEVPQVNKIELIKRDMSNPKDWNKTILISKKKTGRPKGSKSGKRIE